MQSNTLDDHPNLTLLKRIDLKDIAGSEHAFIDDVVFHYFNPKLPNVQGDYIGLDGLRSFFAKIGNASKGTFKVHPISARAVGDELVVTHTLNTMTVNDRPIETNVAVVWRIVDGRIQEVWDIPSVYGGTRECQFG